MSDNASSNTILLVGSTVETGMTLVRQITQSQEEELGMGSRRVGWKISNKYYTALVQFAVHGLERVCSAHMETGPPALVYVWKRGDDYLQGLGELVRMMREAEYEPEVVLGVRVGESGEEKEEEEGDVDVDGELMERGFEYAETVGRVVDALSTIMWSGMQSENELLIGELLGSDEEGPTEEEIRNTFGSEDDLMEKLGELHVTPWELFPNPSDKKPTGTVADVTPWELEPAPSDPVSAATARHTLKPIPTGPQAEVTPWELQDPPKARPSTSRKDDHPKAGSADLRRRRSTGASANASHKRPSTATGAAHSRFFQGGRGISSTSLANLPSDPPPHSASLSSTSDTHHQQSFHPIPSSSSTSLASSKKANFSTADRTILEELKASIRARDSHFVTKGFGSIIVGGNKSMGKRHHAYSKDDVPYPRSYERDVLDMDVWETIFTTDSSQSPTWHVFDKPPAKVLDLGCGPGTWVIQAAQTWTESHFVGLDIVPLHPDLTTLGCPEASRITWVQHNFLESLPFQDEEFDFVHIKRIALGVPEDKWDHLLEEITRVMKPGGRFELIEEDLFFPGKLMNQDDDLDSPFGAADDDASSLARRDSVSSSTGPGFSDDPSTSAGYMHPRGATGNGTVSGTSSTSIGTPLAEPSTPVPLTNTFSPSFPPPAVGSTSAAALPRNTSRASLSSVPSAVSISSTTSLGDRTRSSTDIRKDHQHHSHQPQLPALNTLHLHQPHHHHSIPISPSTKSLRDAVLSPLSLRGSKSTEAGFSTPSSVLSTPPPPLPHGLPSHIPPSTFTTGAGFGGLGVGPGAAPPLPPRSGARPISANIMPPTTQHNIPITNSPPALSPSTSSTTASNSSNTTSPSLSATTSMSTSAPAPHLHTTPTGVVVPDTEDDAMLLAAEFENALNHTDPALLFDSSAVSVVGGMVGTWTGGGVGSGGDGTHSHHPHLSRLGFHGGGGKDRDSTNSRTRTGSVMTTSSGSGASGAVSPTSLNYPGMGMGMAAPRGGVILPQPIEGQLSNSSTSSSLYPYSIASSAPSSHGHGPPTTHAHIYPVTATNSTFNISQQPPHSAGTPKATLSSHPNRKSMKPPALIVNESPSSPPRNPRDHTLLEAIWNGMLASRFVNMSPLSILMSTLEMHFKDVRTHPPLMYCFPPREERGDAGLKRKLDNGGGVKGKGAARVANVVGSETGHGLDQEEEDGDEEGSGSEWDDDGESESEAGHDNGGFLGLDSSTTHSSRPSTASSSKPTNDAKPCRVESDTDDAMDAVVPRPRQQPSHQALPRTVVAPPTPQQQDKRHRRKSDSRSTSSKRKSKSSRMSVSTPTTGAPGSTPSHTIHHQTSSHTTAHSHTSGPGPASTADTASTRSRSSSYASHSQHSGPPPAMPLFEDEHYITMNGLVSHASPYLTMDESQGAAFPPDLSAAPCPNNAVPFLRPKAAQIPNTSLKVDLRTLNLHLALRAKEVIGCAEAMWEWVEEYQNASRAQGGGSSPLGSAATSSSFHHHHGHGHGQASVTSSVSNARKNSQSTISRARSRSLEAGFEAAAAVTAASQRRQRRYQRPRLMNQGGQSGRFDPGMGGAGLEDNTTSLDLTRDALQGMSREDFDQLMNNFELDMQDQVHLGLELTKRFNWHTFPSDDLQDRKLFDIACEKYEKWLLDEWMGSTGQDTDRHYPYGRVGGQTHVSAPAGRKAAGSGVDRMEAGKDRMGAVTPTPANVTASASASAPNVSSNLNASTSGHQHPTHDAPPPAPLSIEVPEGITKSASLPPLPPPPTNPELNAGGVAPPFSAPIRRDTATSGISLKPSVSGGPSSTVQALPPPLHVPPAQRISRSIRVYVAWKV